MRIADMKINGKTVLEAKLNNQIVYRKKDGFIVTVTYNPSEPTRKHVAVTITGNKPITITASKWTRVDEYSYRRSFANNTTLNVTVTSDEGETQNVQIAVTNIIQQETEFELQTTYEGGQVYNNRYADETELKEALNEWYVGAGHGQLKIKIKSSGGIKIVSCASLFDGGVNLTGVDLSEFDTSETTAMNLMFRRCTGISNIDLSLLDTSKVTTMQQMFDNCSALNSLDLSSFTTEALSNSTGGRYMFRNCSNLNNLNISNMDLSKLSSGQARGMFDGIPADCLIKVKDEANKQWVLNIRSDLTNVQIA